MYATRVKTALKANLVSSLLLEPHSGSATVSLVNTLSPFHSFAIFSLISEKERKLTTINFIGHSTMLIKKTLSLVFWQLSL